MKKMSKKTAVFIFMTAIVANLILFIVLLAKGYPTYAVAALCATVFYALIALDITDKKHKK